MFTALDRLHTFIVKKKCRDKNASHTYSAFPRVGLFAGRS